MRTTTSPFAHIKAGTISFVEACKAAEAVKAARPRGLMPVLSHAEWERYLGYFGSGPRRSKSRAGRAKRRDGQTTTTRSTKKR
jgi:hypothetical protein